MDAILTKSKVPTSILKELIKRAINLFNGNKCKRK